MKRITKTSLYALIASALVVGSCTGLAQGRGGNFDPEAMRQRMMDRYQEALEFNDAEWKAVRPLLEDVMEKQRNTTMSRFGGMMMMGRGQRPQGGRQGGQPGDRQGRRGFGGREPDPAMTALQETLESGDASASEIKGKLAALRKSRAKKEAALAASQEKLREVLTLQQEAKLVAAGMLR